MRRFRGALEANDAQPLYIPELCKVIGVSGRTLRVCCQEQLGMSPKRYALGLALVRKHDYAGALDLLRRAHELVPDNARYAYVFAVALNSSGAAGEAMALLEQSHRQHPADRDILMALVSIARDQGNFAAALGHARELLVLDPGNAQLRDLISKLEQRQAH